MTSLGRRQGSSAGDLKGNAQVVGDAHCEGGLAEPRWAIEQDVPQ